MYLLHVFIVIFVIYVIYLFSSTHASIWVIPYFTHIFVTSYFDIITKNNNILYILNIAELHRTAAFSACFSVISAIGPRLPLLAGVFKYNNDSKSFHTNIYFAIDTLHYVIYTDSTISS